MLFNTIDFAIFFPIVFILYWIVAKNIKVRNLLLLIASYIFYGWWDWRFLILIFTSSTIDFIVGKKLYESKSSSRRKLLLILSLSLNLGLLFYFKYTNFFLETFIDSFRLFGQNIGSTTLNIILPVGISFYTFQTLSYTIDIYKGALKPTNNALSFYTFVAFFPQLVAGPIERASHLLPQFNVAHKFDYQQAKSGMLLVAFGLFKKMVIADRVSVLVNQVYNNPGEHKGFEIVVATLFFAFQIYCDFSGYSDIAIGASRLLGFDLMKNFNSPYLSKSIKEFWRRWHISLSTWFRDYVYIPLGGSREGKFRTYYNLFIVFIVSGLWHGAALTFVLWGAIHGAIIVFEEALSKFRHKAFNKLSLERDTFSNRLFFQLITFSIVCFAWVFFRANSISDAFTLIGRGVDLSWDQLLHGNLYSLGLDSSEFVIAILTIVALIIFELLSENKSGFDFLNSQGIIFRYSFYLILIFCIVIFGIYGDAAPKEFIYFQF